MPDRTDSPDRWGWKSDLPSFYGAQPRVVRLSLAEFVRDADDRQVRAWDESIPWLQRECRELVRCDDVGSSYTAILEYELPGESRRPDVILLEQGAIVVLELKGKQEPSQADLHQVAAYARDLRCYHVECANRPVIPILVPTGAHGDVREIDGVRIAGPAGLHRLLLDCTRNITAAPISVDAFLRPDAYQPLPSLVRAARDLFSHQPLPSIKRARAATDPAVTRISAIAHEAAATQTRRLVLLTGVPGSGKTLVGLRLAHAGFLDDLAVERGDRRPSAPAVFLSGNGPLVAVLQDALADAGGGGKAFVRDVKNYVKQYTKHGAPIPPEHLLVFDEAQRAWDADHVARKHKDTPGTFRSEPELMIEFAARIPKWCVVVGLIGTGQEIHTGEHGGLGLWRRAVENCQDPSEWTVHAPATVEDVFTGSGVTTAWEPTLNLNTELRFHAAGALHNFVECLLANDQVEAAARHGSRLWADEYRLLVTRDLDSAKAYARERFEGDASGRYGLLASSKAKDLPTFGVDNSFQSTRFPVGAWYNKPPVDRRSCCQLRDVATEFSSQGLELDLAVLTWGSDLLRERGEWSARLSGKTKFVADTLGLRRNVYRVLLTRGREGAVIFVPPDAQYDETMAYLLSCGARELGSTA